MPAGEVAAAHIDDLALLDQRVHRLPNLIPRSRPIHVMHLVEVDMVGLHAPEAGIARRSDVASRQATVVGPVRHGAEHLRGQHHLFPSAAALGQPTSHNLLCGARTLVAPVPVGGVKEVDAQFQRLVHDGPRIRLGGLRPKVHGAEAQLADLQSGTAKTSVAHAELSHRRQARSEPGLGGGDALRAAFTCAGTGGCPW